MALNLFVAGLSYKSAPVEVREKLAIRAAHLACYGCRLKVGEGLVEMVILSTCNRVEIYGVTPEPITQANSLFQEPTRVPFDFSPHIYVKHGRDAVEHLFSVASGMDSLVLGETEITGQVKQAYQAAQQNRLTGRITNRLFQTALQVAKEIRTETGIGRGSTSIGSVAVDLAERIFDRDLSQKTVMIIGAGKMGEACVRHLAKKAAQSVLVANRSLDRAEDLATDFGGRAVRFEDLRSALVDTDIVVSSTGCPETILHREDFEWVMPKRRNRPLFLIDIAVPRDIDTEVQDVPNVYLYNVDHLQTIVSENLRLREKETGLCRVLIQEQALALMPKLFSTGRIRPLVTRPEVAILPYGVVPA